MNKTYEIKCTGMIDVPESYEVNRNWQGDITGFTLPDGSLVDLFIGLRQTKGEQENFITDERTFQDLGFQAFQYEETTFTEE